jgi:hypothetical protein
MPPNMHSCEDQVENQSNERPQKWKARSKTFLISLIASLVGKAGGIYSAIETCCIVEGD